MNKSYLLTNGLIVDGTGKAAFKGSILIKDDKLTILPVHAQVAGSEVIDCTNKIIAPGFIDVHSQMDYFAVKDRPENFEPFTSQGITTMVVGNCGFSPFGHKCDSEHQDLLEHSLFQEGHDQFQWHNFEGYQKRIQSHGVGPNLLSLVGHGSCRTSLHGFDAKPLDQQRHHEMLKLLDEAMAQGAAGVSLGLQYKPGVFASMDELKDIARLVKKRNKILTVHAKAYSVLSGTYPPNPFGKEHNLRAIDEMLDLARETGVKLQFSHLIFVGKITWPTMEKALEKFDSAIADGIDVKFDIFPYGFGAGLLNSVLPEWVMAGMPQILRNPVAMLRLRLELFIGNKFVGFGFDRIQITEAACAEYSKYNGLFLSDIADKVGKSVFNVFVDILYASNAEARVILHDFYNDSMIPKLMQHPACLFMTDAWPEPSGIQFAATYGAFPKLLNIAHNTGCLSLEQTVAKMTGEAAHRFNLSNQGLLKDGMNADVIVFDWNTIRDNTSHEITDAEPTGIEYVFINGKLVVANSKRTNAELSGDFISVL